MSSLLYNSGLMNISPEARYSTRQIAQFLLEEKVAIHGLSSAVFAQNQALIGEIREAGAAAGTRVLSVGLMGSRAHGTSVITSDVDLGVVYAEERYRASGEKLVKRNAGPVMRSLELDFYGATSSRATIRAIPLIEEEFIETVRHSDEGLISLFHEGVYDTPARRLLGLAALAINSSGTPADSHRWEIIRENYAHAFLGEPERIFDKIQERLRISTLRASKDLSYGLIAKRHEKFGLPTTMAGLYQQELDWFEANQKELRNDPLYKFYKRVLARAGVK